MEGKRLSVKKLGALLAELGVVDKPFTAADLKKGRVKKVGNETYGRDSRVYIYTGSPEARAKLERELRRRRVAHNSGYYPGSGVVECGTTYFKGDRHWE